MVEVNFTSGALDDIDKIADYISQDSYQYSVLQVERFFERVKVLETQPYAGHITPETKNPTIRELHQNSYRIIYKIVNEKRVDILTVHHNKMLLSNNPNIEL